MKSLALPIVLTLLLAAPVVWRFAGPELQAKQMEQAIMELKGGAEGDKAFTLISVKTEPDAHETPVDMPRVPDTAELMKIRYSVQGN